MNKIVLLFFCLYIDAVVNCYYLDDNDLSVSRVKRQSQNGTGCVLPEYPANGKWTLIAQETGNWQPGHVVPLSTVLTYQCNRNHRAFPNPYSICENGQWTTQPTCLKTCSSIESSPNMYVACDLNGSNTSCIEPVDGTKAVIRCATFYEDESINRNPYRFCRDGSWDLPIIDTCHPVCGFETVEATPLSISGQRHVKSKYPWQVAIYINNNKHGEPEDYQFICSGSIITPKIILSAAHCFSMPSDSYILASGKYYRKIDDVRDGVPQKSKIKTLYIHKEYNNGEPYFAFDIAIIVLATPFKMNKYVLPVCFDRDISFDDNNLNDKNGIVTSWSYTNENSTLTDNLKDLEVKIHNKKTCNISEEFKSYYVPYAPDKLCAGGEDRQSICITDSGGPLVSLGKGNRYYIRGIVSVATRRDQQRCDSIQLFTSVRYHQDYIQRTISKHRD